MEPSTAKQRELIDTPNLFQISILCMEHAYMTNEDHQTTLFRRLDKLFIIQNVCYMIPQKELYQCICWSIALLSRRLLHQVLSCSALKTKLNKAIKTLKNLLETE